MNTRYKQSGTILVISLIILLVMTVLVVTSLRGATMEEKMSGNTFDRQLAFQAAEAALRAGERLLEVNSAPALDESCAAGLCTNQRKQIVNGWQEDPTHSAWDQARTVDVSLNGIKSTAKYMIEDMCEFTSTSGDVKRMFRVTAFATGGTDASRVMLQSAYSTATNGYSAVPPNCNCNDVSYCSVACGITCTP